MWITQALRNIDLMTNQGQSDPGLRRHHRPHHSAARPAHRADRADDRGRPRAQQARQRFRADRDECRRHAAWQIFRPFLARRHRRLAAGRRRSASTSRRSACASCGAGRPKSAPISSPTSCSPAASPRIEGRLTFHIRERAAERPVARHLRRRPARPEGARHHPRRAGRHPQERPRHLPRAQTARVQRQEAGTARSGHRDVRPLRLRSVAASPRPAEQRLLACRSAISGNCLTRRRTIRRSPNSPARSAPRFTTASPPRSTRSPSWS